MAPRIALIPDDQFIKTFEAQVKEAMQRVTEQAERGENDFLPITAMFPHGEQDILGIIFTKAARAVGYEMSGNLHKVKEEAQDVLNYAGFLLALLEEMKK
jgi:hypothetical protein